MEQGFHSGGPNYSVYLSISTTDILIKAWISQALVKIKLGLIAQRKKVSFLIVLNLPNYHFGKRVGRKIIITNAGPQLTCRLQPGVLQIPGDGS